MDVNDFLEEDQLEGLFDRLPAYVPFQDVINNVVFREPPPRIAGGAARQWDHIRRWNLVGPAAAADLAVREVDFAVRDMAKEKKPRVN